MVAAVCWYWWVKVASLGHRRMLTTCWSSTASQLTVVSYWTASMHRHCIDICFISCFIFFHQFLGTEWPSWCWWVHLFCCFVTLSVQLRWLLLVVSAADVVVRAHFYKYFHPKEALVSNGVLNRYWGSCTLCCWMTNKAFQRKVRDGWRQARKNSATDPRPREISPDEVVSALGRMKLGTAPGLSLIHIWRCRRIERCRSRWSPYH